MKKLILALAFCFSLVIIATHVYGSPQGCVLKEFEKSKISDSCRDAFFDKNGNFSISIMDVRKAYKAYKKAVKISNKAKMVCVKKWHEDFKEDYYEDMSKEQQKDIETAYKAVVKAKKREQKAIEAVTDASYKWGKVTRSYCKNKTTNADYKIEKAKKHHDKVTKKLYTLEENTKVAYSIYLSKTRTIGEGYNIFTRTKKHQEEKK